MNLNTESKEKRYEKALQYIINNALYQDAWYVYTAKEALGIGEDEHKGLILKERQ